MDDLSCYGFKLFLFVCARVRVCVWDQRSVLRFQLKAVIGPCSQEFKISHPGSALLLVSAHTAPRVFLGKLTEGAASLLLCETMVSASFLDATGNAGLYCSGMYCLPVSVLTSTWAVKLQLDLNKHYFSTQVIKVNVLMSKTRWNCFSFNIWRKKIVYLYFCLWNDRFILSVLHQTGYILVNGG